MAYYLKITNLGKNPQESIAADLRTSSQYCAYPCFVITCVKFE